MTVGVSCSTSDTEQESNQNYATQSSKQSTNGMKKCTPASHVGKSISCRDVHESEHFQGRAYSELQHSRQDCGCTCLSSGKQLHP